MGRLEGEPSRGKTIFKMQCAQCHQVNGLGFDMGPNLKTVADRSLPSFLNALFDPNRKVSGEYVNYRIETTSGETVTGLIARETSNRIVLRRAGGAEEGLLRENIESLESTGRSLMPTGFETTMTPQEVADLMAFLRGAGKGESRK